MITQIETKLYLYMQNNSGGYFVQDGNVDIWIAVEARCKDEAAKRCMEVTQDYGSCGCCGERLSPDWPRSTTNADTIKDAIDIIKKDIALERKEVGERIFDSNYKNPCVIIHLFDGQKMCVEVGRS